MQHPADNIGFDAKATDCLQRLMPWQEDASSLVVECSRTDYSASAIAHAVESADAHLINLNVTGDTSSDGRMVVDLRVSHRNPEAVMRSLERYGYRVTSTRASHALTDRDVMHSRSQVARQRLGQILTQLEV